jgi:threonylcarbamoyladenosine tRNA methylthiotransferase MtaB
MPGRKPRTYRLADLGCKVNQYETQLIAERLEAAGLVPAAAGRPADLCLINTCAVTAAAAAKSARAVRQARRRNPGTLVVVAGCAVSAAGRKAFLKRTGADLALSQDQKLDLPGLPGIRPHSAGAVPEGISRFDSHRRAFIKVQDGCDSFCSYCIVPRLRGPSRSRRIESIAREAAALEAHGHRELVISGVHLGRYGRDQEGTPGLADAVQQVLQSARRCRVRLSSLDPSELGERLLELMAAEPRVCPHLHLPLQSGDDDVLRRMGRGYDSAGFLETVERARSALPDPGITTDVMVGFPGETEAAFRHTVELCRRARCSRLHVFPYSRREGTPAAEMPDQVPAALATERAAELAATGRELAAEFARELIGREEFVLAEEELPGGIVAGYCSRYVRTAFDCARPRTGVLYRVKLTAAQGGELKGRPAG